jgi:hypothetical protein
MKKLINQIQHDLQVVEILNFQLANTLKGGIEDKRKRPGAKVAGTGG